MRKLKIVGLLLLSSALVLGSCREHDPTPDPCKAQRANPLTFRFLESFGTPTPDTAYSKQDITFEGPGQPYTRYEWKVGSDERAFTTRKFSLYFPENAVSPVTVRLIAHRPPNTGCFAKDDGIDTLTQVLTLVPSATYRAPIYGEFEGSTADAPDKKFTIKVFRGPDPFPPFRGSDYNFLSNLGQGCQSPYFTVGLTWRGIYFNYGGNDFNCLTESGSGYLTTRDSIRVDYSQFENATSSKRVNRIFKGKRVR